MDVQEMLIIVPLLTVPKKPHMEKKSTFAEVSLSFKE